MSIINTQKIKEAVQQAFSEICVNLDGEVYNCLKGCQAANPLEDFALSALIENADIARTTGLPVCQDTGLAVVFADIGQDVQLIGDYFEDAVNAGVREAYAPFRKSAVTPLLRENSGDNTPAIIHTHIVQGDKVTLSCMAKGFGSENMSRVYMLTPAAGEDGVKEKIIEAVKLAGSCPCPPVILGVGIGGTMEKAAILSKRALLRPLSSENECHRLNIMERELLEKINTLGIGAEGFGGNVTALGVFIEECPTHIAGLPLAITMQCHCSRHKTITVGGEND